MEEMGVAAKASLRPKRHESGAESCRRKGEPAYGNEYAAWLKLRRWTRRVSKHGQFAFPRAGSSQSTLRHTLPRMPGDDGIPPKDVLDMWQYAQKLARVEASLAVHEASVSRYG